MNRIHALHLKKTCIIFLFYFIFSLNGFNIKRKKKIKWIFFNVNPSSRLPHRSFPFCLADVNPPTYLSSRWSNPVKYRQCSLSFSHTESPPPFNQHFSSFYRRSSLNHCIFSPHCLQSIQHHRQSHASATTFWHLTGSNYYQTSIETLVPLLHYFSCSPLSLSVQKP